MLDAQIKLSIVIPCKTVRDQKLRLLLESFERQDFSKIEMEILTITEGTSESAKAIGIRRARGQVIGIFATDNFISPDRPSFLKDHYELAMKYGAAYPLFYAFNAGTPSLDQYFALIGGNDPLPYYLGKNDRASYAENFHEPNPHMTYGDNAFFVRRDLILQSDLDNYYHIDNVYDIRELVLPFASMHQVFHFSGACGFFKFFAKRYKYGLQHAFNKNRRWHMVEKEDIPRLIWFIVASLTIIHPLLTSLRGWIKIKKLAWFWHPIACFTTVIVYTALAIRVGLARLFRSSYAPMAVQGA